MASATPAIGYLLSQPQTGPLARTGMLKMLEIENAGKKNVRK